MIRVLQCVNNMHRAGLETMLMNYYRHIDRDEIQFDFLMHRQERSDYDDEIEALGGRIFRAPRLYPQNYIEYFKYMAAFFSEHPEYKIVHSHIDAMSFFPLLAAKKAGVPVRIAHSHNSSIDLDMKYLLKQCFRMQIPKVANYHCACGIKAGDFLFRKADYTVIPNAIHTDTYRFDENIRSRMRRQMGVDGRIVIGHVGRFAYQKNHEFLIRIFEAIHKMEPRAVLVLVGEGEGEEKIRAQVSALNLTKDVMFMGKRSDVSDIYQAMDVFVMPSRFEGVPVVGIEAQYAGLPCFFSDRVTKEVAISEDCRFLDLKQPVEEWARAIIGCSRQRNTGITSHDFDIAKAHNLLENYYFDAAANIHL